jgi:histone-lysine N-methyltransferase SETMAR
VLAGELIKTGSARERQKLYDKHNPGRRWQGSALLTLREHLPSREASVRVNIDATMVGNVARFINHSCDGGNLLPCIIRTAGSIIPKLALFARRNVSAGEELTYSYGRADAQAAFWKPCFCGSSACLGRMPAEIT